MIQSTEDDDSKAAIQRYREGGLKGLDKSPFKLDFKKVIAIVILTLIILNITTFKPTEGQQLAS